MSPEDQEEFLSNLEVQLKNLERFTSLKILCVRKVAESLPSYAKQRLTNLSSVLPKTLCSLVYQQYLQASNGKRKLPWMVDWRKCHLRDQVNLFAGNGLEEFDCKIVNMKRKLPDDCHVKYFERFAKESPKLKSFKDICYDWHVNFSNRVQLLSDYYSLQNMSSLVVLEISYYPVKDVDLQVIGTCIPMLQRLLLHAQVKTGKKQSNLSYPGLEYLKNLTFLRHLTFVFDLTGSDESVQLVTYCLQLMPQVNTVGTSNYEQYFVRHEFPSYKDPMEFGLEHLVLETNSVIPPNVSLPNVTKITFEGILTVSLKQFKNLRYLSYKNLEDGDLSQLEKALSEVGHLLKTLDITAHYLDELTKLLQFCTNLEELKLDGMSLYEGNAIENSQLKNCVKNLKMFKHEFPIDRTEVEYFESDGLLHLLLTSCPKLEELQLEAVYLTEYEMDLIKEEIDAGALSIQKLQKIEIAVYEDDDDLDSFAELACKLCDENCDTWKKVDINYCCNDDNYIPALNVTLKIQDCINNKHNFRARNKF